LLLKAARMPRLTVAVVLLALVVLAGTMSYAGYLVIGVVADYLHIDRLAAGLLLGILFARLPQIREGKLQTVGLIPKRVRWPAMLSLLALCLATFLYRGAPVPALFSGLAGAFLLAYPLAKRKLSSYVMSFFIKPPVPVQSHPHPAKGGDDTVIDVEFREKKD
jgi:hypothetical protein